MYRAPGRTLCRLLHAEAPLNGLALLGALLVASGAVTPPELLTFVEAPYPEAEARAGVGGSVTLALTVDAEGYVDGADVRTSAGTALDRAAMAAVLQFVFKPAQRDGVPVGARILYTYVFSPPVALPAPPGPAAADANAPLPPDEVAPIEVTVTGKSAAQRLRESAQAVVVIETLEARQQSADLAEVLARTSQVAVQRQGGLGSSMRLSLAGFSDSQIRYFLDGVPLELAGFPYGVGNVPINLVERVEIYRGVVPVRFGADALGGAINLVSDAGTDPWNASASYQVGSFGTHRITSGGHWQHVPSGLLARAALFFDHATNDYAVNVLAPNVLGQLTPARVRRFHDVYGAAGGRLEVGVVDLPWAKHLLLRGFVTNFNRQIQNNLLMTVPYGAPWTGDTSVGVAGDYALRWGDLTVDAVAGYTQGTRRFVDVGTCIWDWFGTCVGQRLVGGEISGKPHDEIFWDRTAYARLNAAWRWSEAQTFSLAVAPTWTARTGDERRQRPTEMYDPLNAKLSVASTVLGLEHQLRAWANLLENQLFVKEYLQAAGAQEYLSNGFLRNHTRNSAQTGVGDGLRVWLGEAVYAKASYEYATRLPDPEEIFGDAALILPSLDLLPETSHNANLAATLETLPSRLGKWRGTAHLFWREAGQLIVLISSDAVSQYQNIARARALGADASAGWTSLADYVSLDVSATYQDFRNTSTAGPYKYYAGDRIPSIPYFFMNAAARLSFRDLLWPSDQLTAQWTSRYVHSFYRGWESAGLHAFKQTIDAQLIHGAALTYVWKDPWAVVSLSVEVQNLTDARAYDFYGAQRPGRAFYFKTTAAL